MTLTVARFTLSEYHDLIRSGALESRNLELLDGLVVEMSPEGPLHSDIVDESADWLRHQIGSRAKVREAHPITLSSSEPEPDIAIVTRQRYRDRHPLAQDISLVIEVADSSLDKDLNEKAKIYASAGIRDYWLVDLSNQQVMTMRDPKGDRYQTTQSHAQGTISPLAFPDLQVPISLLLGQSEA